jgi:hypothetical protein
MGWDEPGPAAARVHVFRLDGCLIVAVPATGVERGVGELHARERRHGRRLVDGRRGTCTKRVERGNALARLYPAEWRREYGHLTGVCSRGRRMLVGDGLRRKYRRPE